MSVTGLISREMQPPAPVHGISLITPVPTGSVVDFRHSVSSNRHGLIKAGTEFPWSQTAVSLSTSEQIFFPPLFFTYQSFSFIH